MDKIQFFSKLYQIVLVFFIIAQGDPLFAAFWDRVQNKPEETVFQNIEEGLCGLDFIDVCLH